MTLLMPEFCECEVGAASGGAPVLEVIGAITPGACLGEEYQAGIITQGGLPPLTFTEDTDPARQLPAGLSLNPVTGVIVGVPTIPGVYPSTITVADSAGQTDAIDIEITVEICDCEGEPLVGFVEGPPLDGDIALGDVDEPIEGTVGGP